MSIFYMYNHSDTADMYPFNCATGVANANQCSITVPSSCHISVRPSLSSLEPRPIDIVYSYTGMAADKWWS